MSRNYVFVPWDESYTYVDDGDKLRLETPLGPSPWLVKEPSRYLYCHEKTATRNDFKGQTKIYDNQLQYIQTEHFAANMQVRPFNRLCACGDTSDNCSHKLLCARSATFSMSTLGGSCVKSPLAHRALPSKMNLISKMVDIFAQLSLATSIQRMTFLQLRRRRNMLPDYGQKKKFVWYCRVSHR